MKLNSSQNRAVLPQSQRGVVLIVGLMMVVLLTLIGMAAIRGSGLQENMAFNMRDKTVAFQSAESGLRSCETLVVKKADSLVPTCTKETGVCDDLNLGFVNSINNNSTFWLGVAKNRNEELQLPDIPDVNSQPTCLIEIVQPDIVQCNFIMGNNIQIGSSSPNCLTSYRVTAQGVGAESTTQVVLQTTYAN